MDFHTSGLLGLREEEGVRETVHAQGSSSSMRPSSSDNLRTWNHEELGGCEVEGAPEKAFWAAYYNSCNLQLPNRGSLHGDICKGANSGYRGRPALLE